MDLEQTENNQDILYDPKVEALLNEYSEGRVELIKDLKSVRDLKDSLTKLFPEDVTFRNRHLLEDKIKTVSGFYSTILNIRQEINKSISNEIDLRRKLVLKEDVDKGKFDVRELASRIEKSISKEIKFSDDISKKSEFHDMPDK